MIKKFKRLAAVVSVSLILSIAIIPCAVFMLGTQTVAASSGKTETASVSRVTKAYKNEQALAAKQTEETLEKAKAFDTAKKNAETATQKTNTANSGKAVATISANSKYLLDIASPDASYVSYSVALTDYDRDILERLVMGEAGGEGYIGACLVAQAIRDTLVADGYSSVEAVRNGMGYYGSIYTTPNQDVKDAVKFIFDEGGAAVQHTLIYFYAPTLCTSGWHESQEFVVEHNSHRFFDRW
ncbi:MAG: hypothetical protein ACI4GZ_05610 [Ruminococcus sp.]